ncbi:MAG: hypothetical protein JW947_04185 [Sedimentisphaerales bacterium]|nr:hypothetical protein [Sedimentisphaerales bacterium]
MADILDKILFKLGISVSAKTAQIIVYAVAGLIVIILFALIRMILKRRRYKKVISINLAGDNEGDEQAEKTYKSIIQRIKRVKKKYKSILFASIDAGTLPVTVPVNVAIGLAKEKKRCLLIDLDLRRDAVAKVFGLDAEQGGLRAKAVQTEIENLWVWPGHIFSKLKLMNIAEIVEKALDRKSPEKFDLILINAPSIVSSPDRRQIISSARAAFICAKNGSPDVKKLTELIKPSDCTIIGRIQAP